jgi:perosamine synthetase
LRELGYPYRLSDLAAAVGLAQLDRWEKTEAALRAVEAVYLGGLKLAGLSMPPAIEGTERSLSCFPVRVRGAGRRRALRAHLDKRGVRTDDWLRPNHLLSLYKSRRRALPVAEALAAELLYLPFYPGLDEAAAARVVEAVNAFKS